MDDEGGSPHLLKPTIFIQNQLNHQYPPFMSSACMPGFTVPASG
jgi:hypothetical protein